MEVFDIFRLCVVFPPFQEIDFDRRGHQSFQDIDKG